MTDPLPLFGDVPTRPRCHVCQCVIVVDYFATDELWASALHPSWRNGYVCIGCLASAADEKGLAWDQHVREVRLVSLTQKLAPASFLPNGAALDALHEALVESAALLRRYREETPPCHSPHMICHLADEALVRSEAAINLARGVK